MLRRLSFLLPLVILALAAGLRQIDPPPVERFRLAVFDEYQHLKPRAWVDTPVRIVDIDDESLARLGQWPWPRTVFARLLERAGDLGAAVVVFDVLFAEPDRTSPDQMMRLWRGSAGADLSALAASLPDHDRVLATAASETPTVLGLQLTQGGLPRRPVPKWGLSVSGSPQQLLNFLPVHSGAVVPIPELEAAAAGQGNINASFDRDGVIRHVALFMRLRGDGTAEDEVYPSLAAEALRVAQGPEASTYAIKVAGASGEASFGEQTGITKARIGRMIVPTDPKGRLWLYDSGFKAERFIPAWEILQDGFDAERVEGRILFVGASASALKDIRATPLNAVAAGVEVHAQAVEQILTATYLERPDWMTGAELLWLLLFGGALAVLLPRWGAAWCAVAAGTGVAATLGASWLAFERLGWLADPVYPSLTVIVLYLAQSFVLYLRTERERQQVRGAFGRYLSPAVVERLARDPSSLRLGGETRTMTVLFCDIRGFTGISEGLEAGELTRVINRFLTPMTDIILRHSGTIDKYMGDAIMAFWNAPLDDAEHAGHAARAALAMTRSLESLNRAWQAAAQAAGRPYRPIAIGVGLNTGACCVGNLGSEQRFDYSVLGDTVNLASRLEGQSKTYGVPIVAGEGTAAEAPELAWVELDLIRVKGKDRAVRVFALLGDKETAAAPWFRLAAMGQTEMLAAYRRGDWAGARTALARVRAAAGGRLDDLCDLYEDRLARLAASPTPADWVGIYAATEK